jgi:hypothetical protein
VREFAETKVVGTWRQSHPIGGTVGTSGWLKALCACHACRDRVQRVDIKVLWRGSLLGARFPRPSTARGLPRSRVACAPPSPPRIHLPRPAAPPRGEDAGNKLASAARDRAEVHPHARRAGPAATALCRRSAGHASRWTLPTAPFSTLMANCRPVV